MNELTDVIASYERDLKIVKRTYTQDTELGSPKKVEETWDTRGAFFPAGSQIDITRTVTLVVGAAKVYLRSDCEATKGVTVKKIREINIRAEDEVIVDDVRYMIKGVNDYDMEGIIILNVEPVSETGGL